MLATCIVCLYQFIGVSVWFILAKLLHKRWLRAKDVHVLAQEYYDCFIYLFRFWFKSTLPVTKYLLFCVTSTCSWSVWSRCAVVSGRRENPLLYWKHYIQLVACITAWFTLRDDKDGKHCLLQNTISFLSACIIFTAWYLSIARYYQLENELCGKSFFTSSFAVNNLVFIMQKCNVHIGTFPCREETAIKALFDSSPSTHYSKELQRYTV